MCWKHERGEDISPFIFDPSYVIEHYLTFTDHVFLDYTREREVREIVNDNGRFTEFETDNETEMYVDWGSDNDTDTDTDTD